VETIVKKKKEEGRRKKENCWGLEPVWIEVRRLQHHFFFPLASVKKIEDTRC
jgi:hypothetical protein